jgi:hypothetical protein
MTTHLRKHIAALSLLVLVTLGTSVIAGDNTQPPEQEQAKHLAREMHSFWQEVEHEARYRTLPAALRGELEAIEALQDPFDLIDTGEALGLL